mmetsp:Transcript_97055/g.289934  ORF Transcript_97055/g.289934 Transcript_97055/m.289934 type:complete len:209 (+) Transcript_97055:1111-1737(+)
MLRKRLHLHVVRGPRGHAPALRRGSQKLGAVLHARGLRDVVAEELQGLDHHAVRCVVLRPLVVADEGHGHHEEEHEEEAAEDHEVVLLLQQEAGQANAHLRGLRAVGVAILLVVLLRRLVRERIVGLGDLDEPGGRQGVVGVLVGVVDEGELAVGLLDVLCVGRRTHLQDVKGIKLLDLLLLPELQDHAVEPDPDAGQHQHLQQPPAS